MLRGRLMWAENFGIPRRQRESTIFGLKALRQKLLKKVRGQTEATARRRRALALASLPDQGNKQKQHKTLRSRLRACGGQSSKNELERQERLQKKRQLDAADMGVVEVDPAEQVVHLLEVLLVPLREILK